MKFNDFPILSDNDYLVLNSKYTQQTNRKSHIFTIYMELKNLHSSCFELKDKFNANVSNTIEQTRNCVLKLSNNLSELFNLDPNQNTQIKNFNIFYFMKKITKLISLYSEWITYEDKEYFKQTAQKSIKELSHCLSNILNALELSNIYIFKHM